MTQPFHYHQEVYRKLIHLTSLWMPAAIYFFERKTVLFAFSLCMLAVIAYEIIRRRNNGAAHLLEKIFGHALRPDEKGERFKPSGAIYVLTAAFLSALIFPKAIAVTAMAMVLTGDTAAALIGRRFGRTKILDKSLQGALAFFVTALLTAGAVAFWLPGVSSRFICAAIGGALTAAVVELVSKKLYIDDNLSAPLAAGAVMMFLI